MNINRFIKNNGWFLLIALLSLLLKVVLLLQGEVVNPDAATYIAAAERHSHGAFSEGLHYYRMPLYPLLLAATHFLVPDWIFAGQLLTVASLVLVLWPLYALTVRLFDRQAALWTILLFTVLPEFNTVAIMRDPLFLLFTLGALHSLVVFYQQRKSVRLVVFILLAVLATLMRIEGAVLFVIAMVVMFFYWYHLWKTNEKLAPVFVCNVLVFIAIIIAIIIAIWGINVTGFSARFRLDEIVGWGSGLINLKIFSSGLSFKISLNNKMAVSVSPNC